MIYYFLSGIISKNDIAYKYLYKLYYNTKYNIKECCSYSCSNKQNEIQVYLINDLTNIIPTKVKLFYFNILKLFFQILNF